MQLGFHLEDGISRRMGLWLNDASSVRLLPLPRPSLLINCSPGSLTPEIGNYELGQVEVNVNDALQRIQHTELITFEPYLRQDLSSRVLDDSFLLEGAKSGNMCLRSETEAYDVCPQDVSRSGEAERLSNTRDEVNVRGNGDEKTRGGTDERLIKIKDDMAMALVVLPEHETSGTSKKAEETVLSISRVPEDMLVQGQVMHGAAELTVANNTQRHIKIDDSSKISQHHKSVSTCREEQFKKGPLASKMKQNQNDMLAKKRKENPSSNLPKVSPTKIDVNFV